MQDASRLRRFLVIMLVALGAGWFSAGCVCAAPPMSRDDFLKIVRRGVPRADVVKSLGKPTREQVNKKNGTADLVYEGQVLGTGNSKPESVTVVIFTEYDTVHSVRWADGKVAE